jgi:hypothetical protein
MTRETGHLPDLPIPPALVARLQAAAEEQHRSAQDVLRDAVGLYLRVLHPLSPEVASRRLPAEAAARMRRAREGNARLDDATMRELITHGRA